MRAPFETLSSRKQDDDLAYETVEMQYSLAMCPPNFWYRPTLTIPKYDQNFVLIELRVEVEIEINFALLSMFAYV